MQIHTAETLDAMTPEERIELFNELGAEAYGKRQWHSAFAQDSGWSRRTFYNWQQRPETMPTAAVLLLQEWARRRTTPEILLGAIQQMTGDLKQMSRNLTVALKDVAGNLEEEKAAYSLRKEQLTGSGRDDDARAPGGVAPGIDESRL